jgi:siroheme synthase (precorrin-2 oxidase/ferrochelatase)
MTNENETKRVLLIGCGGVGTWLGHGLAKTLQFQSPQSVLMLIDGDSFEPKNAQRQQFSMVGSKAHVLAQDLQESNRSIFVILKAAWIVSEQEAALHPQDEEETDAIVIAKISAGSLLEENDIVYVCVDNFAARKLVFEAAKSYENIDVFTGGNDDRLFGTVYHYCRRDGVDLTLPPDHFHDEIANPPDKNPGELSCQERAELDGGTQLLAVNMAVASHLLAKTAHTIFGTEQEKAAALEKAEIYFDLEEGLAQPYDRRPVSVEVLASAVI